MINRTPGRDRDPEGIDMMLARSTVLVATSAAVRNVVSYGVAAGIPPHIAEKAESAIHAHVSGFKAAHKAGVRLAMGTDSGVPFTRHGNNLDELQHLVEMGLSPQEAIRVATLDSARLLKLDDCIGSRHISPESGVSAFAQDNHMVDALASDRSYLDTLASDRSDQSFGEAVLPRRAWGNWLVADADGP